MPSQKKKPTSEVSRCFYISSKALWTLLSHHLGTMTAIGSHVLFQAILGLRLTCLPTGLQDVSQDVSKETHFQVSVDLLKLQCSQLEDPKREGLITSPVDPIQNESYMRSSLRSLVLFMAEDVAKDNRDASHQIPGQSPSPRQARRPSRSRRKTGISSG